MKKIREICQNCKHAHGVESIDALYVCFNYDAKEELGKVRADFYKCDHFEKRDR